MELIAYLLDICLHIDKFLTALVHNHGTLVYVIIALIIFCEVGLVIAPFLPGDSMLFIIGALCASGAMDLTLVLTLFPIAAVAGDNFNRHMGVAFGRKAFCGREGRFFNQKNLDRAQSFFEQYGNKAITLCRFIPFFRTFIPFVAGMAGMCWRTFFLYSVLGGVGWVVVCVLAGYYFGNLEFIQGHFELVLLTIIAVSAGPAVAKFLKKLHGRKRTSVLAGEVPLQITPQASVGAWAQKPLGQRLPCWKVADRGFSSMSGWRNKGKVLAGIKASKGGAVTMCRRVRHHRRSGGASLWQAGSRQIAACTRLRRSLAIRGLLSSKTKRLVYQPCSQHQGSTADKAHLYPL